jgi:uncharacterized protein
MAQVVTRKSRVRHDPGGRTGGGAVLGTADMRLTIPCRERKQPARGETTVSLEANKQVIRDFFAALTSGDRAHFQALLDADVAWTIIGSTPLSKTYRGHAGVEPGLLGAVRRQIDTKAGVKLDVIELIAEGDKVVARVQGTVSGKFGPYNNTYCHVFTVRNGKITNDIEYLDTALIEHALYGKRLSSAE